MSKSILHTASRFALAGKGKFLLTLSLFLLINALCIPLWTECDYGGFVRTLFDKEARLDLLYTGKITRVEPFQYQVTQFENEVGMAEAFPPVEGSA